MLRITAQGPGCAFACCAPGAARLLRMHPACRSPPLQQQLCQCLGSAPTHCRCGQPQSGRGYPAQHSMAEPKPAVTLLQPLPRLLLLLLLTKPASSQSRLGCCNGCRKLCNINSNSNTASPVQVQTPAGLSQEVLACKLLPGRAPAA